MNLRAFLFTLTLFCFQSSWASHIMGGDLTWKCQGGEYVFQLVFYRDCNGADVNPISTNIEVWNHATINTISLDFFSREDVSPLCTEVPGGPVQLECGVGGNAGNGPGSIEKVIYRSNPIDLAGTPPPEGWIFTYQDFSRSNSLTNITDPSNVGITLSAKMFDFPGNTNVCIDQSAQFLQEPYFVSCAGSPYEYNMNAIDPDLDSLSIFFGIPYDHFPSGTSYDPPVSPAPITFEPGFSATSPTPDATLDPANIPAQIDGSSGNLTFFSNTIGNFNVKVVAQSYRNGILISEVEREMQLIVMNCTGNNTRPTITGPFGGLFETTITAGDPINFTLSSTDIELLQDGSPQSNILLASGPMFGTNFTSTTGCDIAPCATLDQTPLITMSQGVSTDFNWQTSCDHLVNSQGDAANSVPYHFVFKIQDDYCPVPKVSYATITINVENPGVVLPPQINCIQDDGFGNLNISWDASTDVNGTFIKYDLYSIQNGLEATSAAIGTTSFTIPSPGQQNDYYLAVTSGCNGNTERHSDTVSNIYLDVTNPGNGTAVLTWNSPTATAQTGMNSYYHIYREFPAGNWFIHDSIPFGATFYIDTIDICSAFINYRIVLPNAPCDYISNFMGDDFVDMITPDIPQINVVTVDTLSGDVYISWNENYQPDTYGYVIYVEDENGFIVEIDTVWGQTNTTYINDTIVNGPFTYSVAAFDSCFTVSVPPTYQTSAKAELHSIMYLEVSSDICNAKVNLNWSDYIGWVEVDYYEVYSKLNTNAYQLVGTTTETTFSTDALPSQDYCFFIKAYSDQGEISFSNVSCLFVSAPNPPSFNYLEVATVQGENVFLKYFADNNSSITGVSFQRLNEGVFEEIIQLPISGANISYIDSTAEVNERSYTYRVQVLDSCGNLAEISNIAQTIFLSVVYDDVKRLNYIHWNPYQEFDGSVVEYYLFRQINGVYDTNPIQILDPNRNSFVDSLMGISTDGKICYTIVAYEGINQFGNSERSYSNEACAIYPPIIYIPNAFIPQRARVETNKIFKPILSDFDPEQYEFTIFDRWGGILFQTQDPNEGWDGIIRGTNRQAQPGTYLYLIILNDGEGIEVVRRGHVSLLN